MDGWGGRPALQARLSDDLLPSWEKVAAERPDEGPLGVGRETPDLIHRLARRGPSSVAFGDTFSHEGRRCREERFPAAQRA